LTPEERAVAVQPVRHSGWQGDEEQWFVDERHAHALRDRWLRQSALRTQPRIGLLQRRSGRTLLQEEELLVALRELAPTDVETFESKGFREQMGFMNGHDIVVSPHGAQLTSVPFMPDCGGVVEVYPRYYWIPGFFGSLANNSGLEYRAIYTSAVDPADDVSGSELAKNAVLRREARAVDLCVSIAEVVRAVEELLARRERCMARRGFAALADRRAT